MRRALLLGYMDSIGDIKETYIHVGVEEMRKYRNRLGARPVMGEHSCLGAISGNLGLYERIMQVLAINILSTS